MEIQFHKWVATAFFSKRRRFPYLSKRGLNVNPLFLLPSPLLPPCRACALAQRDRPNSSGAIKKNQIGPWLLPRTSYSPLIPDRSRKRSRPYSLGLKQNNVQTSNPPKKATAILRRRRFFKMKQISNSKLKNSARAEWLRMPIHAHEAPAVAIGNAQLRPLRLLALDSQELE